MMNKSGIIFQNLHTTAVFLIPNKPNRKITKDLDLDGKMKCQDNKPCEKRKVIGIVVVVV